MKSYDFKSMGNDVRIDDDVLLKNPKLISLANHVAIDYGTVITTSAEIGNFTHISFHTSVIGGKEGFFKLGDFSHLAAGARIIVRGDEHSHGYGLVSPVIPSEFRDMVVGKEIIIGDYVSIGTNAVVMPNCNITEGIVVGAGSVVTKPITEEWTIWVGAPARKIAVRPKEKMILYASELKRLGMY